ncbi:MAG: diguanylate cyclase [Ethanoligenens sp.]
MNQEQISYNIFASFTYGVCFVDLQGNVLLWNDAAQRITGYAREEAMHRPYSSLYMLLVERYGVRDEDQANLIQKTLQDEQIRTFRAFLWNKQGRKVLIWEKVLPVYEQKQFIGVAQIFTDDLMQDFNRQEGEVLLNLAMTDILTNLPNRRSLESALHDRQLRLARHGKKFCVLFVDLDNFKKINDQYGHMTGDRVLTSVSANLIRSMRNSDIVGRWGGEEFIGIYAVENETDMEAVAKRVRDLINHAVVRVKDELVSATVSIGVTMAKEDDTSNSLIGRADLLMYHSKRNGKDCVTSDVGGVFHTFH